MVVCLPQKGPTGKGPHRRLWPAGAWKVRGIKEGAVTELGRAAPAHPFGRRAHGEVRLW